MVYPDSSLQEVDAALLLSHKAFHLYKLKDGKQRAHFLRAIASEIESIGQTLIDTAMGETNLPEGRIIGERARTVGQCRMFADLIEEGSWVEARIDTAIPDRSPVPKPDIRKMLRPLGPVVVFGAANFPLAYSTAGGDTISALAAGCSVVVKAHPAHTQTSTLVASAIEKARTKADMPEGVFVHLYGANFEVGKTLVEHTMTKAVGFTGSFAGGKALFDMANKRPVPIPVFAEMSSINPVILLPNILTTDYSSWAQKLSASITLNAGQFCTSPGLLIGIKNQALDNFKNALIKSISEVVPSAMLHQGILTNYTKKVNQALLQDGVSKLTSLNNEQDKNLGTPVVTSVAANQFLLNPLLQEEVFGPFALIVECEDQDQLTEVISNIHGQLTTTVIGNESEIAENNNLLNLLAEVAGRIIINGVPTGVEVCPSMNHGGPFPATTDSRFTAVGVDAIKRFVRPVSFQNFPQGLLPNELKDGNPLTIWRLFNNELTKG